MRRIIMTLSAAALLCTGAIAQRKATPAAPTSSVTPQSLLERAEASLYRTGATVVDFSTQLQDKAGRSAGSTTGKMYLQGMLGAIVVGERPSGVDRRDRPVLEAEGITLEVHLTRR